MVNPYVSFYQYLSAVIDQYNGVLLYNSAQDNYLITANKAALDRHENHQYYKSFTKQAVIKLPNTSWCNLEHLNGYAYSSDARKEISNHAQTASIYQSHVSCTPVQQSFDHHVQQAASHFNRQQHQQHSRLELEFDDYPNIDLLPGALHDLNDYGWSKEDSSTQHNQRVTHLHLNLKALTKYSDIDYKVNQAKFLTKLKLELEPINNPTHYLPFKKQLFSPVEVEGLIVSEVRNTDDLSFDLEQDKNNQQIYYKVAVPLWGNQHIQTAHAPNTLTGHMFFPLYKNQRVLIKLFQENAEIKHQLDWRPELQSSNDKQGNGIKMGLNESTAAQLNQHYDGDVATLDLSQNNGNTTQFVSMTKGKINFSLHHKG
ncbi:hypothetical protein [Piscirickettsia litoralis]|uniref:Uncharacterized protein n=1 Tax=Piscirickettsia litoralis TaxID=1891921 RepID=A0ABX3A3J3_9GAMM|nr:hypothetical protein [Piscirickettsia litoralis]ODN42218.1 hypothetical protein BGC07_03790 [Piscirickettsia litoralis]